MLSIPKAILSTKEAIAYCGGKGAWDQLLNAPAQKKKNNGTARPSTSP